MIKIYKKQSEPPRDSNETYIIFPQNGSIECFYQFIESKYDFNRNERFVQNWYGLSYYRNY